MSKIGMQFFLNFFISSGRRLRQKDRRYILLRFLKDFVMTKNNKFSTPFLISQVAAYDKKAGATFFKGFEKKNLILLSKVVIKKKYVFYLFFYFFFYCTGRRLWQKSGRHGHLRAIARRRLPLHLRHQNAGAGQKWGAASQGVHGRGRLESALRLLQQSLVQDIC